MSIHNFHKVLFALFATVLLKAPGDAANGATELGSATLSSADLVSVPEEVKALPVRTIKRAEQFAQLGLKKADFAFEQLAAEEIPAILETESAGSAFFKGHIAKPFWSKSLPSKVVDVADQVTAVRGITSFTLNLTDYTVIVTKYGQTFIFTNDKDPTFTIVPSELTLVHPRLAPGKSPNFVQVSLYYTEGQKEVIDYITKLARPLTKEERKTDARSILTSWSAGVPIIYNADEPYESNFARVFPAEYEVIKSLAVYTPAASMSVASIINGTFEQKTDFGSFVFNLDAKTNDFEAYFNGKYDADRYPEQTADSFYGLLACWLFPYKSDKDDDALNGTFMVPDHTIIPIMARLNASLKKLVPNYNGLALGPRVDSEDENAIAMAQAFNSVRKSLKTVLSTADGEYGPYLKEWSVPSLFETIVTDAVQSLSVA